MSAGSSPKTRGAVCAESRERNGVTKKGARVGKEGKNGEREGAKTELSIKENRRTNVKR